MNHDQYLALHRRLTEAAPPRVVELRELLHPHAPPEDERWPAPRFLLGRPGSRRHPWIPMRGQPTLDLLARLAPVQAWLCAWTAAEMVLPAWFGYAASRKLAASQRLAPHVALRNARRWIAGHYRLTDLLDCAEMVGMAISHVGRAVEVGEAVLMVEQPRHAPIQAARAAMIVAAAATYLRNERDSKTRPGLMRQRDRNHGINLLAAQAVLSATLVTPANILKALRASPHLGGSSDMDDEDRRSVAEPFLTRWWARCRCRLAFADAPSAHIEFVR